MLGYTSTPRSKINNLCDADEYKGVISSLKNPDSFSEFNTDNAKLITLSSNLVSAYTKLMASSDVQVDDYANALGYALEVRLRNRGCPFDTMLSAYINDEFIVKAYHGFANSYNDKNALDNRFSSKTPEQLRDAFFEKFGIDNLKDKFTDKFPTTQNIADTIMQNMERMAFNNEESSLGKDSTGSDIVDGGTIRKWGEAVFFCYQANDEDVLPSFADIVGLFLEGRKLVGTVDAESAINQAIAEIKLHIKSLEQRQVRCFFRDYTKEENKINAQSKIACAKARALIKELEVLKSKNHTNIKYSEASEDSYPACWDILLKNSSTSEDIQQRLNNTLKQGLSFHQAVRYNQALQCFTIFRDGTRLSHPRFYSKEVFKYREFAKLLIGDCLALAGKEQEAIKAFDMVLRYKHIHSVEIDMLDGVARSVADVASQARSKCLDSNFYPSFWLKSEFVLENNVRVDVPQETSDGETVVSDAGSENGESRSSVVGYISSLFSYHVLGRGGQGERPDNS